MHSRMRLRGARNGAAKRVAGPTSKCQCQQRSGAHDYAMSTAEDKVVASGTYPQRCWMHADGKCTVVVRVAFAASWSLSRSPLAITVIVGGGCRLTQ